MLLLTPRSQIDALFSTSEVQSSAEMLQANGGGGENVAIQSSRLRLFATAQGGLAMLDGGGDDADGGSVSWVAPSSLSSPIVTAIDPSTNHRISVTTVEDDPHDGGVGAGGGDRDRVVVKMLPGGDGIYALPVTSGAKGDKPRPGER